VHTAVSKANEARFSQLCLAWALPTAPDLSVLAEAVLLSNYQFLRYFREPKAHSLQAVTLVSDAADGEGRLEEGVARARAACVARDLVNEPANTLTAEALAQRAEELGQEFGFGVEVLNKARIKALKMGGLLAVNAGSQAPPTFSILSYEPEGGSDQPPVVLVGKGVVYDTGGLSLKPTANSMDFMKSDMGGAAAVIGALCGVAALKLPRRVIGLIPATDNRPGEKAYAPGDVIRMYDGSTVEVLNTDAEGRMILADALAYAKQYDPALVIDLATLTGSAVVALGHLGMALMSTAGPEVVGQLLAAGDATHERVVAFPLWDEYAEQLRSDIADRKNIGGRYADVVLAGKFLQAFTDYPWVHLDIAGPAWLPSPDSYRGKGGSGVGVRLLIDFLQRFA
jgi:leucyl aminopeptidase